MTSSRKVSLVAGIFFALTFVHVAILFLYDSVLNDADFILNGNDTPVRLGALSELIVIVANVATAVTLFQVLRRQNEGIALGYVAVRTFESTMIAIGTLSVLSLVTLREDLAVVAGADATHLTDLGASLVAIHDWTFLFGPGLCSGFGNGLLLGYLMLRSGLVPRNMALIGVIGGPLSLVGCMFVLFGAWDQDAPPQFAFTIGEIVWELSLTFYLIFKGFKPSPILVNDVDRAAVAA